MKNVYLTDFSTVFLSPETVAKLESIHPKWEIAEMTARPFRSKYGKKARMEVLAIFAEIRDKARAEYLAGSELTQF